MMNNHLFGVYGGLVEELNDPDRVGRVKVRVPAVYGTASEVPTDALPWALPRGLPFGSSSESGGISWLPAKGDTVWVSFLDGEPEKPLWEWAVAPAKQAAYLHKYEADKPKRAALTRYGHIIEFNATSIIITTPTGEAAIFDTEARTLQLQNSARYIVRLDPDEITLKAGDQLLKLDNRGAQINALAQDCHVTALQDLTLQAQRGKVECRRSLEASATTLVQLASKARLTASGTTQVSITSSGTVELSVGDCQVQLTPANLELAVGGHRLSISPAGFLFT